MATNAPANRDFDLFDERGFAPFEGLLPNDLVASARREAEALFTAFPASGDAALTVYGDADRPLAAMARIDHPQLASAAVASLVAHPALAWAAARLMGANAVQAWYCHMSRKPPVGAVRTHIGWHQDGQYSDFFEGRFVTAWVPLSAVDAAASPICYVLGSQKAGVIGGSGFSGAASLDELKARLLARSDIEWNESEVCASPGTVSFHDSLIVHGSRDNLAATPRLTLTIHMRSERNRITRAPSHRMSLDQLRDSRIAPVIYGARDAFADLAQDER